MQEPPDASHGMATSTHSSAGQLPFDPLQSAPQPNGPPQASASPPSPQQHLRQSRHPLASEASSPEQLEAHDSSPEQQAKQHMQLLSLYHQPAGTVYHADGTAPRQPAEGPRYSDIHSEALSASDVTGQLYSSSVFQQHAATGNSSTAAGTDELASEASTSPHSDDGVAARGEAHASRSDSVPIATQDGHTNRIRSWSFLPQMDLARQTCMQPVAIQAWLA